MAKINVTRSSMPTYEEYCAEIKELFDSRWLTNGGVKHEALQSALQTYLNVPCVELYANGHLALENVLSVFDFPVGGEVITTPFTFASTTHAIVRCGLTPVFCDINPTDYTMDVDKIEALITDETVAILPVHVYGNLCDTEAIDRIAKKHGLTVIYDAAHAFGVTRDGMSAATFGDASMFSFHATKVFHTVEGGAVCFKDPSMAPMLREMRNFGLRGKEDCSVVGGNAKMNEFQAAMGLCNLRHIGDEIAKRAEAVALYRQLLVGKTGIRLCAEQKGVVSNYAYFPVVFDGYTYTRDQVFERLMEHDIMARKYFYPLTSAMSCYRDMTGAGAERTPVAAYVADRVLTLPLYADISPEDVEKICDVICS